MEISPGETQQWLHSAARLMEQGQWSDARTCFLRILDREPDHFDALHILGVLEYQAGDLPRARELIGRALSINPGFAEAHYNLGRVLQDQGRRQEAIAAYTRAFSLNRTLGQAAYNLGLLCAEEGNHEQAAEFIQRAIECHPRDPDYYFNLGNVLSHLKKREAAIQALETAVQLDPANPQAWNNLGILYKEAAQFEKALFAYQQAVTIHPDFVYAYFNMGNLHEEIGDLESARTNYQRAVASDPGFSKAWNNLGNVLYSLKEFALSRAAYERAVQLNPENATSRHMLHALDGVTSDAAPPEYVTRLFDKAAPEFEQRLVHRLGYRSPKELREMLFRLVPADTRFDRVVDLGCGTGLSGREFRSCSRRLVGVDLSGNMVQKARESGYYDDLFQQEIVGFLQQSEEDYDLFLATDVLVYIGDFDPLFEAVRSHSRTGARFLFSLESGEEDGYRLRPTGRFAHSKSYVETCSAAHGFSIAACETTIIRTENDQPIPGMNYILDL